MLNEQHHGHCFDYALAWSIDNAFTTHLFVFGKLILKEKQSTPTHSLARQNSNAEANDRFYPSSEHSLFSIL